MQWAGIDITAPVVMGILNVTPDSFSDGGDFLNIEIARQHAEAMCQAGAKIIDIGGESTRPGAVMPSIDEEIARIVPVIAAVLPIVRQYDVRISVDTRCAAVMMAAHAVGADIINDISALTYDVTALSFVAQHQLPVVLCHMQGTPQTMQRNPVYADVVAEVCDYLAARIAACEQAGLARDKIAVDPGIGFGKTTAHNIALLQNLIEFKKLNVPILVGVSRKRFIADITGADAPKSRLAGSLVSGLFAISRGANILRVHDVRETVEAVRMWRVLADDR